MNNHVPGTDILRRPLLGANTLGLEQFWLDYGHDLPGNCILQREDIGQVAVVAVGPDVVVRGGID